MNLAVTGHRPNKIGGYDTQHPLRIKVRAAIRGELERIKPDYGLSGMALGVDQEFATLCVELGIPFIAAIPFVGQESIWPPKSQVIYNDLLAKAFKIETISQGGYAGWKMNKRNIWLVNQSHELLAVWDGSSGGTCNCVEYAEKNHHIIHRINPKEL